MDIYVEYALLNRKTPSKQKNTKQTEQHQQKYQPQFIQRTTTTVKTLAQKIGAILRWQQLLHGNERVTHNHNNAEHFHHMTPSQCYSGFSDRFTANPSIKIP